MKALGRFWKILLALVLAALAAFVYFGKYRPGIEEYGKTKQQLETVCETLRGTISENAHYADAARAVEGREEELDASRLELYRHFNRLMREEDQLLYLLDLEKDWPKVSGGALGFSKALGEYFGSGLDFAFGQPVPLTQMADGAVLVGLPLKVYFVGNYSEMKKMADYLAEDPRITSVIDAQMDWKPGSCQGRLAGSFTVMYYNMDSELLEYDEPVLDKGEETGKDNIFVR